MLAVGCWKQDDPEIIPSVVRSVCRHLATDLAQREENPKAPKQRKKRGEEKRFSIFFHPRLENELRTKFRSRKFPSKVYFLRKLLQQLRATKVSSAFAFVT